MSRKERPLPPFAEPGLETLKNNLRGGLAQLVPSGNYGGAPFSWDGGRKADHKLGYLMVRLEIVGLEGWPGWKAVLGVYDRDDFDVQVWRPLTWINWRILMGTYAQVCEGINEDTIRWLRSMEEEPNA